ncbi:MAG: DUF58 domain-containing protein [Planctomycetota bacterium]
MIVSSRSNSPADLAELLPPDLRDRLDRLDVHSRRILRGRLPGDRASRRRGQSVEFDDHRPYRPGDDLRHVDWNIYTRLDRLFLKLFREEDDLAVHVLVDVSASMDAAAGGRPSKRVVALRLAAALGYVALVNQNRLFVRSLGEASPEQVGPMRGRRSVERLGRALVSLASRPTPPPGRTPALEQESRAIARQRLDRGVCLVISDFLAQEDPGPALRLLASAGGRSGPMDGVCLQVLDPAELDPALARDDGLVGDLRLIDAESGAPRSVTVTDRLVKAYASALDRRQQRLLRGVRSAGFRHAMMTTDEDIAAFMLHRLRSMQIVR